MREMRLRRAEWSGLKDRIVDSTVEVGRLGEACSSLLGLGGIGDRIRSLGESAVREVLGNVVKLSQAFSWVAPCGVVRGTL